MVKLSSLKFLSGQMQKDAKVLFHSGRYVGSVYLMGYALEFAFKKKISLTLGFNSGFPDTRNDYSLYANIVSTFITKSTGIQLSSLHDIRNHNLSKLLTYSGVESRIVRNYYSEWLVVKRWKPEDRYRVQRLGRNRSKEFLDAAFIILKQIL